MITASSASVTYGAGPPGHHPLVLGLRQRRHRRLAHDGADVLDHGHASSPVGSYPTFVLGGTRPELRDLLPERFGHGHPGAADDHGVVGDDVLRREPADRDTRSSSGLQNGEIGVGARSGAHLHRRVATSSSPVGTYAIDLLGRGRRQLRHHLRQRHHHGHPGTAHHHGLVGHA